MTGRSEVRIQRVLKNTLYISHLNSLRLHFAGQFQANVSTVNNDPLHFDNSQFLPSYQTMQAAVAMNGWFNPAGDAAWRLIRCKVTSVAMPNAVPDDPILACLVADSESHATAKLVDLDPEQQLVSEIWGLQVRITDPSGKTLLSGNFEPLVMDIWDPAASAGSGGDQVAGAMYQSVLTDLKWADVSSSAFLLALKAAAADGLLSIKFNVDGINLSYGSPDFMCGRIVGTIGPATVAEPHHFVMGRQFMASARMGGSFFAPAGQLNFCVARLDQALKTVFLDLGNALRTPTAGGVMSDLGSITLRCPPPAGGGQALEMVVVTDDPNDPAAYTQRDWYTRTAGIVELPLDSSLTAEQLTALANSPLSLCLTLASGTLLPAVSEWSDGIYVGLTGSVFRMNPGVDEPNNKVEVEFGTSLASAFHWPEEADVVSTPAACNRGQLPWDQTPPPAVATPRARFVLRRLLRKPMRTV